MAENLVLLGNSICCELGCGFQSPLHDLHKENKDLQKKSLGW